MKCMCCGEEFEYQTPDGECFCDNCGEKILTPSEMSKVMESAPEVGSKIQFGNYDWIVLHIKDCKALLLCDKIIEKRYYHPITETSGHDGEEVYVTWYDSNLCLYLNGVSYWYQGRGFYDTFGSIVINGSSVTDEAIGIRPALWIKLWC